MEMERTREIIVSDHRLMKATEQPKETAAQLRNGAAHWYIGNAS